MTEASEAAAVMQQIIRGAGTDYEKSHNDADEFMVRLLRAHGYHDAMDIYEASVRWMA